MLLFCRYGVDASDPSVGEVIASYEDGAAPAREAHPNCILVPYEGTLDALGRIGPEPEAPHPSDPRPAPFDWRPIAAPRLDIVVARSAKLEQMSDACGAAIAGGFTSSALGSANVYVSTDEAQRNLSLAAGAALSGQQVAGWTTPLKCGPAGQKAMRQAHTAAQVHAVLGDFVAFKASLTSKFDDLKAKVAAAGTPEAVSTIAWS